MSRPRGIEVLLVVIALAPSATRAQEDAGSAAPSAEVTTPGTEGPVHIPGAPPPGPERQAPEGRAPEGEPSPPTPSPTAASSSIGEVAARTRVALQSARPLYRTPDAVGAIERSLPRVEPEVAALASPARLALAQHLSQRELAELHQDWQRRAELFESWQTALSAYAADLERARNELVEIRRVWADLRRGLPEDAAPGRRQRITSSLDSVRAADDEIDRQLEIVLALEERVTELSIVSQDAIEHVNEASAALRERVFVRDLPPLWQGTGATGTIAAEAEESWGLRIDASSAMLARQSGTLARDTFAFAALAALLAWLATRARRWLSSASDPNLERARVLSARPIAVALLLILTIAPLTLGSAPILLYDAVFVLTLIPLARVLPALASPSATPLWASAIGLLFANRIESTIEEGSGLRRVLLVIECVLALIAIAWWLWRSRAAPRVGALRVLALACGAAMSAALVANVLGYVLLATVIVRGTAFSVYSGLTLFATLGIAMACLDVLVASPAGAQLATLRDHGPVVRARTLTIASLAAALGWLAASLSGYGLHEPVSKWIENTLVAPLRLGEIEITLGAVALSVFILVTTHALARLTRFVLELDVLPRFRLEPGVEGAISGLTRYVIYATGLLLGLAALGIDGEQIALVAGALGVGVGFGLQGIVANFIAGLVLMLERPVRIGDFVDVGSLTGRVERIGLRSSTIRTLDGSEVIVPNESLISREVVNWTLSDRKRRLVVKVGVAYGTDPRRVIEILERLVRDHEDVLAGPEPEALFVGFGESSLDFVLYFWTDDFADAKRLESAIAILVHDALVAAGIEIPFPQRDLHIRSVPEGAKKKGLDSGL